MKDAVGTLKAKLRLPVIAAPMFLVSGPDLAIAACRAGIVGSFTTLNARTSEQLVDWFERVSAAEREAREAGAPFAPLAVNLVLHRGANKRLDEDLKTIERYRPGIVITSSGQPRDVAARINAYGGVVFHDVASMRHAHKAIEQGVDGLILLTAGAGGHTGWANAFAFVPQVRRVFDGAILLAGGISDGHGILAAEALGADFAYMGTRFAATRESMASPEYHALLVNQAMEDVIVTDRVSGMNGTFLRGSIALAGLDPDALPPALGLLQPAIPETIKAWRDVWSGGHGVGMISDVPPIAELVDRLDADYHSARKGLLL